MNDDKADDVREFLREYAQLVRKYGMLFAYDAGYETPQEVYAVQLSHPNVERFLNTLDNGEMTTLYVADVPGVLVAD